MRKILITLLLITALLSTSQESLRDNQIVKVVKKVSPAVVSIFATERVKNPFFFDDFFELFQIDPFFEWEKPKRERQSLGSGFIVDPEGYILTNEHVVLSGQNIQVSLSSEKNFSAKLVGAAPECDLALLKIDTKEQLPVVELGDSDDLMIGETVIAVGNPFGLSKTVTVGVLSATGRTVNAGQRRYSDFLQTDAAINPGNSGGPLLNILGKVIGVNTAIIKEAQGIGFAIPINRAKRVMEQLKAYGKTRQIWLGALIIDISERYKRKMNVDYGVVVAKIYPFAHPNANEFQEGDIIQKINGKKVSNVGDYNSIVSLIQPEKMLSVEVVREGERKILYIKSAYVPESLTPAMVWELLGLKVEDGRRGVVVKEVKRGSVAHRTGINVGDIIIAVGGENVVSAKDFYSKSRIALTSTGLPITIGRGNWAYYVTLNLLY